MTEENEIEDFLNPEKNWMIKKDADPELLKWLSRRYRRRKPIIDAIVEQVEKHAPPKKCNLIVFDDFDNLDDLELE